MTGGRQGRRPHAVCCGLRDADSLMEGIASAGPAIGPLTHGSMYIALNRCGLGGGFARMPVVRTDRVSY